MGFSLLTLIGGVAIGVGGKLIVSLIANLLERTADEDDENYIIRSPVGDSIEIEIKEEMSNKEIQDAVRKLKKLKQ